MVALRQLPPAPVLARLEKEAIAVANTTAVKARLQVMGEARYHVGPLPRRLPDGHAGAGCREGLRARVE
ncbi:hypothetical protein ACTMU2_18980 [Cupriavidus basilensis]